MKILQVISYGYLAGGAEKSVLFLKNNLTARGHEVRVVASDHNKDASAQRFSDVEFPEIDAPGVSLAAKTIRHLWYGPSAKAIKDVMAEFRPDIVHFHVMGQLSPSAIFAVGSVPAVLTVHGPEEYVSSLLEWGLPKYLFRNEEVSISNLTGLGRAYYLYFRFIQRPIYRLAFRRHVKALIAPSKYMASVLQNERYGVPIRQIYNGIELPKPRRLRNLQRLLYVGRLEHVKGVDVLLQAMKLVVDELPDAGLSIVGDGAARLELEAYVAQHEIQHNVQFYGWLDAESVARQYMDATAVVIPSIWPENLPTVCIEALASGRPVVGTNTGGIPELISDGRTGYVVAKGNARDLARSIVALLSRSDLPAVSTACAESMKAFSIDGFVQNLEALYGVVIRKERL